MELADISLTGAKTIEFSPDHAFQTLVSGLYAELGHEAPDLTPTDDPIRILDLEFEEVAYRIMHDRIRNFTALTVSCTFGPIPASAEGAILTRLLELNLMLHVEASGMFCIDPESGQAAFLFRWPLYQANALALLAALQQLGMQARNWRLSHFLDQPETTLPAAFAVRI